MFLQQAAYSPLGQEVMQPIQEEASLSILVDLLNQEELIQAESSIMEYLLASHRVTGLPHTKPEAVTAADEIYKKPVYPIFFHY